MRSGLTDHFQSGLIDNIQQVLGIHRQSVSSRQHLLLVLLLQAGHDVLLRQLHLVDELGQVRVQQLLGHLNLEQEDSVSRATAPSTLLQQPLLRTSPWAAAGTEFPLEQVGFQHLRGSQEPPTLQWRQDSNC